MRTVDLDDKKSSYNEALAMFDTWAGKEVPSKLRRTPLRHIFWNFWNLYPEDAYSIADDGSAKKVVANKNFYAFSDRPAENSPQGLLDRFVWDDYLALSYVWGDQSNKKEIILNGSSFLVGHNLYNALLRLRDSWEVSTRGLKIWIDAICINTERAVEVKKMTLIYSEALLVRGWLGQAPDDTGLHFGAVREALSFSDDLANKVKNHRVPLLVKGPDGVTDVNITEISINDDEVNLEASGAPEERVLPTSFSRRILEEVKLQTLASKLGTAVMQHER